MLYASVRVVQKKHVALPAELQGRDYDVLRDINESSFRADTRAANTCARQDVNFIVCSKSCSHTRMTSQQSNVVFIPLPIRRAVSE